MYIFKRFNKRRNERLRFLEDILCSAISGKSVPYYFKSLRFEFKFKLRANRSTSDP